MSFVRLHRSLWFAGSLVAGMALLSAPNAEADVSLGASIVIPFTNGMVQINVGDTDYRFYDGFFYRPMDDGHHYRRVKMPYGAYVSRLPKGAHYARGIYQLGDTYFIQDKKGYRVIDPRSYEYDRKGHKDKGHHGGNKHHFDGEPESRRGHH
jgi:hypothetical protein